ncbi:peptidase M23 [Geobacillus sp. 46C-IIa]|uniref:M23 family metallopeptidase n=1 Tax=Geobacillus sp. 46C-IIa TaxID=1963025 RepID=UPI0009BF2736|nr:M23 family metallopeptidase [Geobacillus sp. 46C-IIa]OQP06633.1 peptidase M23 [Geobacillus sp. 46C-IIa]QNU28028.1 M23 family metallopeptidase [Geobacillus sp. 46C-IIa]QNU28042.1 M23 family metallopeptidase [Geobacillus sp. 46C-IIa]
MREEQKQPSLKRFFRKRWVFPAIYLSCAALIVAGALWFQAGKQENAGENDVAKNGTAQQENPAIPVNETVENIAMPVLDPNAVQVKTPFYDENASEQEQEAALVFYDHTYHPNQGIDLVRQDGKTFDVTASLSGTVTKAEKDPILGYVVEINHEQGVTTVYQSLADVKVEAGDTVKQGEVIGKAGQSEFNKEAGIHVHFEIRKDGKPVNPIDYVDKPLTALTDKAGDDAGTNHTNVSEEKETTPSDETAPTEDHPANETEQTPADDNTTAPSNNSQDQNQDTSSYKTPDASIGMARA